MTKIYPKIRPMTFDEQDALGLQNAGMAMEVDGRSYFLRLGTRDLIMVIVHGVGIYVLSGNPGLSYLGFEEFHLGHVGRIT